jgi:chromatin remodeling complex protein RSC6
VEFFKSEEEIEIDKMPKGDGLTRPLKLSDDLAAIVGVEEASRAECVKLLWAYLKANELQVNLYQKLFFFPNICSKRIGVP